MRLYCDPTEIVSCDAPGGVEEALARVDAAVERGFHAAGFMTYELGYALEPRLARRMPDASPLLWFGLFPPPRPIDARSLDEAFAALGPPPPISDIVALHSPDEHARKVRQILELIAGGDIYQANLTYPIRFRYGGDPLKLYGALRVRQPVAHGGIVAMPDATILSVSPELFVEVLDGQATTRPMKGTTARNPDPGLDSVAKAALAADPKQRAENLMIVDLLRNDLARISRPGTVRTPALFTVETYPTFHTLTSTVTGELRPETSLRERIGALFPCGSIVGAPKIRAAEIISDLEAQPRGVYTGAIGTISPGGDLDFNVAIRTAVINADGDGAYGVGGGVVADSDPAGEYEEALLKARILNDLAMELGLIETFRWSSAGGFHRLDRHLDRLTASAVALEFVFDRHATETELARAATLWVRSSHDRRVRLLLTRDGDLTITHERTAAPARMALAVCVADERLDPGDPFLRHKTSRRDLHERAFAAAAAKGLDEAVLLNRASHVADASRNSIFAEVRGVLVTPPITAGALPGVLRAALIADGRAIEGALTLEALRRADRWFLGNSLHGLRRAQLAPA